MAGGISSILFVAWISFSTQANIAAGKITFPKKPVSVSGCSAEQLFSLNVTDTSAVIIHLDE